MRNPVDSWTRTSECLLLTGSDAYGTGRAGRGRTLAASVPPGRNTRRMLARAASGSEKQWKAFAMLADVKKPSACSRSQRSPCVSPGPWRRPSNGRGPCPPSAALTTNSSFAVAEVMKAEEADGLGPGRGSAAM